MQMRLTTTLEPPGEITTMKNIMRAFALSLVVTGAFASSHMNNSVASVSGKVSAFPIPSCDPGDKNGCGICNGGGCFIN